MVDPAIAGLKEGEKCREKGFSLPCPRIQIFNGKRFYENALQLVKPKSTARLSAVGSLQHLVARVAICHSDRRSGPMCLRGEIPKA
jgi:hypothetical protein